MLAPQPFHRLTLMLTVDWIVAFLGTKTQRQGEGSPSRTLSPSIPVCWEGLGWKCEPWVGIITNDHDGDLGQIPFSPWDLFSSVVLRGG